MHRVLLYVGAVKQLCPSRNKYEVLVKLFNTILYKLLILFINSGMINAVPPIRGTLSPRRLGRGRDTKQYYGGERLIII